MTLAHRLVGAALLPLALHAQQRPLDSGVWRYTDLVAQSANNRATSTSLSGSSTSLGGSTKDFAALSTRIVSVAPAAHAWTSRQTNIEQLIIVKSGRLRVTLNGMRRTLGEGSVAIVMANDSAEIANVSTTAARYYSMSYQSRTGNDTLRTKSSGNSFMVNWNDVVFNATQIGGGRRIFDRATGMFDRFEMHASTLNAGLTNHPAHTHGAEEMVVVLRGTVSMLIGDVRKTAEAGDVIFLASMIPHSLDNIGKVPAEYFAFQWQSR